MRRPTTSRSLDIKPTSTTYRTLDRAKRWIDEVMQLFPVHRRRVELNLESGLRNIVISEDLIVLPMHSDKALTFPLLVSAVQTRWLYG